MINLKKFKELHSKRQTKNLTVFEKYKIQSSFKSPIEGLILTHLYTKFLYFKFKEFNQRKFDIKVGIGNFSENTITNNLKSLEKKGYFTSEFKQVKGKNYNRLHFNINLDKMNEFLSTGDDLKPENFSMLIENLRRENEVVKDNPCNKPKKEKEMTKPKKETPVELPTQETPTPTIIDNDEPITHSNDDRAIELKKGRDTIPEVKEALEAFKIANYDISMVYGNNYVKGECKEYDHKREVLDVVYDEYIIHNKILS